MKKNNVPKNFHPKRGLMGSLAILSILVVMCRNKEQQHKIETLDNQIADLDTKINQTRNIRHAPVPTRLRGTQARYNKTVDSLNNDADTVDLCVAYNDSLIANAFNKYAMRVGRDFQLSQFLSINDINVFQKQIATLDTMDFVQENARQRILRGSGSLNDLSYFLELIDFDSVNASLFNKLAWNFDNDSTTDADAEIIPVLGFDTTCQNGAVINRAMRTEQNLLDMAWMRNDTNTTDSVASRNIPEIDSLYQDKIYQHNDSLIRARDAAFQRAMRAEDSLADYENTLRVQRDSLQRKRDGLSK